MIDSLVQTELLKGLLWNRCPCLRLFNLDFLFVWWIWIRIWSHLWYLWFLLCKVGHILSDFRRSLKYTGFLLNLSLIDLSGRYVQWQKTFGSVELNEKPWNYSLLVSWISNTQSIHFCCILRTISFLETNNFFGSWWFDLMRSVQPCHGPLWWMFFLIDLATFLNVFDITHY